MSKLVTLKDGPKEVKVGDELCVVRNPYYKTDEPSVRPVIVTKIGNKYIEVVRAENVLGIRPSQFHRQNGAEVSKYTANAFLYSSEAAYREYAHKSKTIDEVITHLRGIYNNGLTYEQAIAIAKILDIELEG